MAGGIWSRLKTWSLNSYPSSADINAEFDNIKNNSDAAHVGGYSDSVSQMQIQSTPGAQNSESLAASVADELKRLRFVIARLLGTQYWYDAPNGSLNSVLSSSSFPLNRLASGRVTSSSGMSLLLTPAGTTNRVTIKGATTPFVYYIGGVQCSINIDLDVTGLTPAPSSGNTCVLQASPGPMDIQLGEGDGNPMKIGSVGSAILSLAGQMCAFKAVHGGNTDYFIGIPYSSDGGTNYFITNCYRGFFFDSTGATLPRQSSVTTGDTITLCKLTYLFVNAAGAADVCYTNPTYSKKSPVSPSIGDYWYDMSIGKWKKWSGTTWTITSALLIGMCIQDGSNTVAARSLEYFQLWSEKIDLVIDVPDPVAGVARAMLPGMQVSVAGQTMASSAGLFTWDPARDMDTGLTIANTTKYWFYLTDQGDRVISTTPPYDRPDLGGFYHPWQLWRAVAYGTTNGSAKFVIGTITMLYKPTKRVIPIQAITPAQIAPRTLTPDLFCATGPANPAPIGQVGIGSGTGAATSYTNTGSLGDVAGTSVTIFSTGRPVWVGLIPDPNAAAAQTPSGGISTLTATAGAGGSAQALFGIVRDSTVIARTGLSGTDSSLSNLTTPPGTMWTMDFPAAGSHTYKFQGQATGGTGCSYTVANMMLVVIEL